jgi:GT2 family glycosyltransferase
MVDVTLLQHNHFELTVKCLDHLKEHTNHPYRLTFVDNASSPSDFKQVRRKILNEFPEDSKILRTSKNLFYAGGTNVGLRESGMKYVVALSNDVFVTENWLTKLVSIMDNNPKIGLLSPLTDNISRTCVNAQWVCEKWNILGSNRSFMKINSLKERFLDCQNNVPMFCAMIRQEVLQDVGYLHEEFFILGNDDDYNDRVRIAGWRTCSALNVFVEHIHGATKHELFPKPERSEIRKRHRALLTKRKAYRALTGDYKS